MGGSERIVRRAVVWRRRRHYFVLDAVVGGSERVILWAVVRRWRRRYRVADAVVGGSDRVVRRAVMRPRQRQKHAADVRPRGVGVVGAWCARRCCGDGRGDSARHTYDRVRRR